MTIEENMLARNLSNNQTQDILDDIGMIDDNRFCPYTAEEIFRAGINYADSHPRKGLVDIEKVEEFLIDNLKELPMGNNTCKIKAECSIFEFIEKLEKAMMVE